MDNKNFKNDKIVVLNKIFRGVKNKKIVYDDLKYEDLLNLNKKKIFRIKYVKLKNYFRHTLECLEIIIELYKELYNKTEYFENKMPIEFNMEDWNKIRKVNGRLTKYYNELKTIERSFKNEKN